MTSTGIYLLLISEMGRGNRTLGNMESRNHGDIITFHPNITEISDKAQASTIKVFLNVRPKKTVPVSFQFFTNTYTQKETVFITV